MPVCRRLVLLCVAVCLSNALDLGLLRGSAATLGKEEGSAPRTIRIEDQDIAIRVKQPKESHAAPKDSGPRESRTVPKESGPKESRTVPKESGPKESRTVPKESGPKESRTVPKDSGPKESRTAPDAASTKAKILQILEPDRAKQAQESKAKPKGAPQESQDPPKQSQAPPKPVQIVDETEMTVTPAPGTKQAPAAPKRSQAPRTKTSPVNKTLDSHVRAAIKQSMDNTAKNQKIREHFINEQKKEQEQRKQWVQDVLDCNTSMKKHGFAHSPDCESQKKSAQDDHKVHPL